MSNIALPKIDQSIIERKKYIFSKLKKLTATENFLSHEAGVAVVPGTAFGKKAIDYVRFSFAASQNDISKALEKIRKMLG